MTHNRLLNLNEILDEAKSVANELGDQKIWENINDTLAKTNKDPLYISKKMKYYPRYVVWELTLACNMRCGHCGSTAGLSRKDELSPDQMLHLCDELGELECERLTLLGGEPLIHPHWKEITKQLQKNNIRTNVITNGWTLANEKVCDDIKEAGLTIVGISIDGLEKSHDKLRRPGSFQRISEGMDMLKERDIPMAVCTVITSDSIKDLYGLYDFLVEKGVSVWQIQIASPLGRLTPDDPLIIKPAQIKQVYDIFHEKRELKNGIHIDLADDVGYFLPTAKGYLRNTRKEGTIWTGCHAGMQVLGIDSNGDIKGCQSLPSTPEFIEGNVKERSLKEIWFDSDNFQYNRNFKVDQLEGFCALCKYGSLCRGGCGSAAISHTGSKGNNPMCYYRHLKENENLDFNTIEELKAKAKELLNDSDLKRARAVLLKINELEPADIFALDNLGFACYMTGKYGEAVEYCNKSIELKPDNYYAYKGLGLCLVESGDVAQGIKMLKKSIKINPDYFDSQYDLAIVLMNNDKRKEALPFLKRAMELNSAKKEMISRFINEIEKELIPT